MSEHEVLRMVARLREDVSGPLKRIELGLRGVGRRGATESKALREGFNKVHDEFKKVSEVAKTGVAPAFEAIGLSSLTAVGAIAALTAGLKNFADQGADVAAFGRRVQLTTNTIRGPEGVAEKFEVDPGAVRQGLQSFTDQMYLIRRRRGELYAHLLAQRHDIATELAATPETVEGNEQALKTFLKLIDDIKKPGSHGEPTARMFAKEVFGTDAFVDLLREGNAGLEERIKLFLRLSGAMDTAAGQRWIENWSDFKATIEGVRNVVGNDLLPELTAAAKQAETFFAENKVEIGHDITQSLHTMATAMREVNTGVQAIGGWKQIFEALIALKLVALATRIAGVASAVGALSVAGSPPAWMLALLGVAATGSAYVGGQAQGYFGNRDIGVGPGSEGVWDPSFLRKPTGRGRFSDYLRTGGIPSGAAAVLAGLRARGLDAEHAAILAGNIEQESGFDPTKPNIAEGGIGLIQWRLERRAALQRLARLRHKSETDLNTQLDFLFSEFKSTPAGQAFLAAHGAEAENSALHGFILYGDNSEAQRLAYGRQLLPMATAAGGSQTVTGNATLKVDVNAPRGTSVKAAADGLFDTVEVNRGLAMEGTGL